MFKVARGESYEIQNVIDTIADAAQRATIFLSRRETYDYVASI